MTLRDLLTWLATHPHVLLLLLLLPAAATLVANWLRQDDATPSPAWRYAYSAITYATCIPGVAAAVVTVYSLVFTGSNLLDLDITVYFLPIIAMAMTLLLVSRGISFDLIPGFDRLRGLMAILAIAFVLILIISKTRIWLFFGSSLIYFVLLLAGLLLGLRWASRRFLGR
ncbi:MAG: hypothetical protein DHS20C11_14590 [Lysobacteraceae bacterium]|nr:MAG: hypothetical protein DHS20C11_14590 [Xanthomonadaceae bacterium]